MHISLMCVSSLRRCHANLPIMYWLLLLLLPSATATQASPPVPTDPAQQLPQPHAVTAVTSERFALTWCPCPLRGNASGWIRLAGPQYHGCAVPYPPVTSCLPGRPGTRAR
eukprot:TRINITY_DN11265_c0_g3_i1.p1 TRINITY_DN11265_c0_g3~~TRINITY_DN11265_c0_g3_i1.p1  ORF type:complete len:111 (+),score=11.12 TRINITY_DN11265_c0_g3_i1:165-497(+)